MKPLNIIIACLFLFTLCSCSSHYRSVNQVNDQALLQLSGNFLNTELSIDGGDNVIIDEKVKIYELNDKQVVEFPISTGKHSVKIFKDGLMIVNRVFYSSNGNVFEVVVP